MNNSRKPWKKKKYTFYEHCVHYPLQKQISLKSKNKCENYFYLSSYILFSIRMSQYHRRSELYKWRGEKCEMKSHQILNANWLIFGDVVMFMTKFFFFKNHSTDCSTNTCLHIIINSSFDTIGDRGKLENLWVKPIH